MSATYPFQATTSPSGHVEAVTPSDSANFTYGPCRGISLGAVGTLSIVDATGNTVTFVSGELVAGVVHPIQAKRVNSTGTAATPIKAYW